jgi:predicted Rossmann fold nucleotide-binding protein DprA/Smf involved in DNA uptake
MKTELHCIERGNDLFPESLLHQDGGFSQIYAIGNIGLLNLPLLGFFCSTRCPGDVILRTYDIAKELRKDMTAVISGFHTPVERDCLDILLKGRQPVVISPARGITDMRIPMILKKPLEDGRLLILSPFEGKERRMNATLAERRNRFVALIARNILIAYAAPGSRTEQLGLDLLQQGKNLYLLDHQSNNHLIQKGGCLISRTIRGQIYF